MTGDAITLTGIRARGHHGVLAHETEIGQTFVADVTLEVDLSAAAGSDDLADTIDYGAVASLVHQRLAGSARALIEAVAGDIADSLLAHDGRITTVEVTVHKPGAPVPVDLADVAVTLRRSRG